MLIDGHSLLFRAYHALPKTFTNKEGQSVNAVYGFMSMLIRVVGDLKPGYLAVAFDEAGPTFRHAQLFTYKEGRAETDEDLKRQIPMTRDLLRAFNVPNYSLKGYEGEDVLATMVTELKTQISKLKIETEFYIVSGDRDVAQLVDSQVRFYMPKKGLSEAVIYDEKNVEEVFGVKADQVADFKGLCGDASDQIPGVYGIGEKTAAALINRFGSVENLYKNMSRVRAEFGESVEKKLIEGAEQAVLSKYIAQINHEAPLAVEIEDLKFPGLINPTGIQCLSDLGFRSILRRLGHFASEQLW